jgi:OFA family oxalate/formate antiporter-like MFS transporter
MEISVPNASVKRWPYLVYGFFMMLFLGLIYAWSVFITPLETTFGWVRSQTSLIFTISMSSFCVGGIVAGILIKKISFRKTLYLSALFILSGFVGATRIDSLLGIYLTYGVLCGFGVGLGYNATLGLFAKWYPDKPGFCSGALLMGFGFGGLLLGNLATYLMGIVGWQGTFIFFGIISAILLALSTHIVGENPPEFKPSASADPSTAGQPVVDMDYKQMVKQPSFWLYSVFTMFMGASGLAVIGNAVPIAQEIGMPIALATTVAGLISVTNGASRIIFGSAFDLIGKHMTMFIDAAIAVLAIGILIIALSTSSIPLLIAGFILIGMAYGGVPPTSASFANRMYGPKNFPVNFSIININIIPASLLGPALAGVLQVSTGSYLSAFYVLLVLCLLGGTAGYLIKK